MNVDKNTWRQIPIQKKQQIKNLQVIGKHENQFIEAKYVSYDVLDGSNATTYAIN